jgi:hypothetical protein
MSSNAGIVFVQRFISAIKNAVLVNTDTEVIQISNVGIPIDENRPTGPAIANFNVTIQGTPFVRAYAVALSQLTFNDPTPPWQRQKDTQTLQDYVADYGQDKIDEAKQCILHDDDDGLVMLSLPDEVVRYLRGYIQRVKSKLGLDKLQANNPVDAPDKVTADPARWWQVANVQAYPTQAVSVNSVDLATTTIDTQAVSAWSTGWWIFSVGHHSTAETHSFNQAENIVDINVTTGVSRVSLVQGTNVDVPFLGAPNLYLPGNAAGCISAGTIQEPFLSKKILPYYPVALVVTANTTIQITMVNKAFSDLKEHVQTQSGGGFFFSFFPIGFASGNVSNELQSCVTSQTSTTVTLTLKTAPNQPQVIGRVYSPVEYSPATNPPAA